MLVGIRSSGNALSAPVGMRDREAPLEASWAFPCKTKRTLPYDLAGVLLSVSPKESKIPVHPNGCTQLSGAALLGIGRTWEEQSGPSAGGRMNDDPPTQGSRINTKKKCAP